MEALLAADQEDFADRAISKTDRDSVCESELPTLPEPKSSNPKELSLPGDIEQPNSRDLSIPANGNGFQSTSLNNQNRDLVHTESGLPYHQFLDPVFYGERIRNRCLIMPVTVFYHVSRA